MVVNVEMEKIDYKSEDKPQTFVKIPPSAIPARRTGALAGGRIPK